MNKINFIAALKMHGFKTYYTDNNITAYLGNKLQIRNEFSFKIHCHDYESENTPLIEISGTRINASFYTNYRKAYLFIVKQELK